jgi:hypothetical protein
MSTLSNILEAKLSPKYHCEICHYKTSKKSNYKKHCESIRHKNILLSTNINKVKPELSSKIFQCKNCEKIFKERTGLWRHKQKCNNVDQLKEEFNGNDKDSLLVHLLKKNEELQNKIIEMSVHSSINNNSNSFNTTNNAFNLNFFLNETCKDAMNITDFVSSINMNLDDLVNTGRRGYIEGISNIIIKNLNKLENHMRPLHCSDFKREVLYIKDNNQWHKENENKPILTKAIKTIANENIKQINKWKDNNPDCIKSNSKKNDLYLNIVSNSMNGITKEEGEKNINKIISNVAKNVIIEK